MEERTNGLSLDFIIHPGETVKEALEDRQMSQEELAIRTGFSPKHISEVINGKKGISPALARSLEYVFGISTSFWINLQGLYDKEMLEYKEQAEIEDDEIGIVKSVKNLIKYAEELGIMAKNKNIYSQIIELRNICNIKNLTYINFLPKNQIAFRKSRKEETNFLILYIWMSICEINAQKSELGVEYCEQKLRDNLINIKKCMLLKENDIFPKLKKIFAECGIIFQVMKNFSGAPVQGFIKKCNNVVIITMTIRKSLENDFWFTLFHEIGHLLNGDVATKRFIDYEDSTSEIEDKANKFAKDILINKADYKI